MNPWIPLPLLVVTVACSEGFFSADHERSRADTDTDADADTDTDTDSDADTDADADSDADSDTDADPCAALAPTGSPSVDRAAIEACLAQGGVTLTAGTFDLDAGISVPAGATVRGAGAAATTLRLTLPGASSVLSLVGGSVVSDLRLDGNDQLTAPYVNAAVVITGSDNRVEASILGNSAQSSTGTHDQAVYFVDAAGTRNVVSGVDISGTFYGVIFVAGLPSGSGNRLEQSTIHDTRCDSVTLVGYGEVVSNTIYETGWDCENGPIPGGGIYSLWNTAGALVEDNTIFDTCGHGIDLDTVQGFSIVDNVVYDPGYQWDGWAPWCIGAAGISMIDASYNTVAGNVVDNNDRPGNAGWDPNNIFRSASGSAFSDLPFGASTVMAFVLSQRSTSGGATVGNSISDNTFRAACASGCGGVGYYASRGTGTDASGGWSASTTNYYQRNNPFGSNWGSVRCGGNWYAGSSTCPGDPDCNTDDDQHSFDWSRNDDCRDY